MSDPLYRRVIVKLSGEALTGKQGFGIDQATVERLATDLAAAAKLGVELGVVVGGGNIFRGVEVSERGVPRPVGDTMGMLATVMNCLVLEAAIERAGCEARTLSALAMTVGVRNLQPQARHEEPRQRAAWCCLRPAPVIPSSRPTPLPCCAPPNSMRRRCLRPPMLTVSTPPIRKKTPRPNVTTSSAIRKRSKRTCKVMDGAAFALARENRMPIIVFSIAEKSAIEAVLRGKGHATVVG